MFKRIVRGPKKSAGAGIGAGILFLGVLLSSCAGGSPESDAILEDAIPEKVSEEVLSDDALVSASGFDGTWPFGADEVRIECLPMDALGVTLNGELFALNGVATSAGYEELTPETPDAIWVDDPTTDAKVSLGDFSKFARNFCGF